MTSGDVRRLVGVQPVWAPRDGAPPLVIAHRGASADAIENTLAAFRLAREQGADGVELDVMLCGTGEPVVFHDDDLERLGRGARGAVRMLPLEALRAVDLGGGEHIPTLDETFEELAPPMLVNVELKSAPTWGGRARDDGLAAKVADVLRRHGAQADGRVLVSSFDPLLLLRFKRALPEVPVALLFAADQALPLRRAWAAPLVRPYALHPEAALVDAAALERMRRRAPLVNVWTVDAPAELRALAALGVDGVITNRPRAARAALVSW